MEGSLRVYDGLARCTMVTRVETDNSLSGVTPQGTRFWKDDLGNNLDCGKEDCLVLSFDQVGVREDQPQFETTLTQGGKIIGSWNTYRPHSLRKNDAGTGMEVYDVEAAKSPEVTAIHVVSIGSASTLYSKPLAA